MRWCILSKHTVMLPGPAGVGARAALTCPEPCVPQCRGGRLTTPVSGRDDTARMREGGG